MRGVTTAGHAELCPGQRKERTHARSDLERRNPNVRSHPTILVPQAGEEHYPHACDYGGGCLSCCGGNGEDLDGVHAKVGNK